ncbi:MAG TPA: DUF5916 domain-containing protein, partial [Longimicrobiales bacterium]|nr:DUF5916 domain-containing protein [Longimicrobiales bacterium]
MRSVAAAALVAGVLFHAANTAAAQQLASAQSKPPARAPAARRALQAVRVVDLSPAIDGRLDEAVWQHADVATDFIEHEPASGEPSDQRTEARVLYDDGAIYVGMRAFDTAPDSIVGRLARRDENPYSDWLLVAFDSYFDRRTAFIFGVNPAGARIDSFMYDDGNESDSWDPVWEVRTTRDSLGWSAEFRIPLSQLRFNGAVAAARTWGVQFHRKIARTNERSFWAPMPRDGNGVVSYFGELHGLAGLRPPRHLEIQPYSVSSVTTSPPGAARDPFHQDFRWRSSIGADFKYGVTSHLTLSGTLNPDFGQVESDPSVVNLTAYETFLQEKRPFFVEGADIFNFGLGIGDGDLGNESLFYSRRIGRAPQGGTPGAAEFEKVPTATTIVGAAKLSGKTARGWSLGMLEAVTAGERAEYVTDTGARGDVAVEPWTNYAMARVARDFDEGRTAFGVIATATNRRLDDELSFLHSAAYTGGLNARHRWQGGDFEVSGWLAGSHVRGDTAAIARTQRSPARYYQRPDAAHTTYDATRTSLEGWAGGAQLGKLGGGRWRWIMALNAKSPGFEANDMGFQSNADRALQVAWIGYQHNEPGR